MAADRDVKAPTETLEAGRIRQHQIDPIIHALLVHLPEPGSAWADEDRANWLSLLTLSFKVVYKEPPPPPPPAGNPAEA